MKYNRIFKICMLVFCVVLSGCRSREVEMTVKEAVVSGSEADIQAKEKDTVESALDGGVNVADEFSHVEGKTALDTGEDADSIYVYVCGHVGKPGVYAVDKDARIYDAIVLAGGVSEDGRGEALNQAEHMTDGQTIYVPGLEEEYAVSSEEADSEDGWVNLNTASREELMTLPGIGESKAETIIQYREEHGAFKAVEDLMAIPGIKEGIYNRIKDQVRV